MKDASMIQVGDLLVTREKKTYSTVGGEVFPIKIGFHKKISYEAMQRLAIYAFQLEYYDGEAQDELKQKESI